MAEVAAAANTSKAAVGADGRGADPARGGIAEA